MQSTPPPLSRQALFSELDRARHLWAIGQRAAADQICRRVLAIDPQCGPAWFMLGTSAVMDGNPEGGVRLLDRAIAAGAPADARQEFAHLLLRAGQPALAVDVLRQAVAAAPQSTKLLAALGGALHRSGRVREAAECYRQVLERDPALPVRASLAGALKDMGRFDEALAEYERALADAPQDLVGISNLLWATCHVEDLPAAELYARHRTWGQKFAVASPHVFARPPSADLRRPLKVGFVSADLRSHAVAFYLLPVWRGLDRRLCTVHAYASQEVADDLTDELRKLADAWVSVGHLDHDMLAARIRADGIDVLVDLSGHCAGNRLPVLARRAAPVQATWLYPCTTGVPGVDYFLADEWLVPRGLADTAFSERIVRLPAASTFDPPRQIPPVRPLPALRRGHLTFGSFHRPSKLSRRTLACWAEVLRALPTSRLLMASVDEEASAQALRDVFAAEGVDPQRLQFHGRRPLADYLALHHEVDLALDALGYSGSTTTLHALLMGVPVLSVVGESVPARQSATILHHVGLASFAVSTVPELAQRACDWAGRLQELAELRAGLRDRLLALPLVVDQQVPRSFAIAVHALWRRWAGGQDLAALTVAPDGGTHWDEG